MFHHGSPCFTMFHHVSPCFTMFHHASPCFTLFHRVSPCFTMFHHVSPCFTMFHHVSPCFTMFHHISDISPLISLSFLCPSPKHQFQTHPNMNLYFNYHHLSICYIPIFSGLHLCFTILHRQIHKKTIQIPSRVP